MGLISVAVALPVDMFLGRAFEIANEGDMPGNWLDAPAGRWKLILGKDAHNGWRLDDPRRPVSEFTRWIIGGGAESDFQVVKWLVAFALRRLWALLSGRKAPEVSFPEEEDDIARRSSMSEAGGRELSTQSAAVRLNEPPGPTPSSSKNALPGDGGGHDTTVAKPSGDAESAASSGASARGAALEKRLYASAGLLGVYVCWTVFAWVIFTYGMLIYKTLGADAQNQFAQTWGVGYALNNASEWQDVFQTAAKAAVLLVILDMLRLTKNATWFEEHVDFVSLQAVLFNGAARSWWQQTHTLVKLQSRLTDD